MQDRTSRIVVITGASAGVGRATATAFARRGDTLALLARGPAGLDAAAEEARGAGARVLTITADVADPDAIDRAADQVEAELGPIDVWVNDGFASVFAPFTEIAADEFRRVTEVCYLGFVHGTWSALRVMRPRDHGTIVQVGSALAYRGIPLQSAYCGAKHAIQGFTESLRCELRHDQSHVRLTMVQLPAVNTPQFSWVSTRLPRHPRPVPPVYQPEVAARAVLWASEHYRREWWVGSSTVGTLVANAVAPGLLERYLGRTGYASQQTDEPIDPNRPDNLWKALDDSADHGATGIFDDEAKAKSRQWTLTTHRNSILAGLAASAATATAVAHGRRGRR